MAGTKEFNLDFYLQLHLYLQNNSNQFHYQLLCLVLSLFHPFTDFQSHGWNSRFQKAQPKFVIKIESERSSSFVLLQISL